MNKFVGKVGFWSEDKEVKPGIWKPGIIEKDYYGDIIQNNRRWQNSGNQNDAFVVNNRISILSDLYAQQNYASIKYVVWNDIKLKVTSVEMAYPRLILEIGGEYVVENAPGTS